MICRTTEEFDNFGRAFGVGDTISFDLTDGEHMEAIAVKEETDGMIFCAVDCLAEEQPFKRDGKNAGGYEKSDLREILNTTILHRFPDELVKQMVPFDNGDLLRIPTEKEIFGSNEWCEAEGDEVTQWEPMKLRRNRIAFQGHNGAWEWYWLMSRLRSVGSAPTRRLSTTAAAPAATGPRTRMASARFSKSIIFNISPPCGAGWEMAAGKDRPLWGLSAALAGPSRTPALRDPGSRPIALEHGFQRHDGRCCAMKPSMRPSAETPD